MIRIAVTHHALTAGDPTRTIHFVVGRALARRLHMDEPWDYDDGDSLLAWNLKQDDPDMRRQIAFLINGAWVVLAVGFVVAMVLSVPIKSLAGDATGNAFLTGCLVTSMSAWLAARTCYGAPTTTFPRQSAWRTPARTKLRHTPPRCAGRSRGTPASFFGLPPRS
jgi:hypothetical protein